MPVDAAGGGPGSIVPRPPHVAHRDPAVQLLLDRLAVEDLFCAYAAGVDRRDFDLVAACFAEDVHGAFGGVERRDRAGLLAYIEGVRFFHTTMHMLGNVLIEVAGDAAQLDADAMVEHRGRHPDGRDVKLHMSGSRYRERLERRGPADGPGGGWCIVERAVLPVFAPTGATRAKTDDPAVRWLLDRAEIRDLLSRYATAVDERRFDAVRACFAEELDATYLGRTFDDVDALLRFIRGVEHFGWTRHFTGRPTLAVSGDAASSHAVAILASRAKDDPKGSRERSTVAGYRDELVREAGRWRIRARRHGPLPELPSPPEPVAPSRPSDPAIAYLVDRARVEDAVVAHARALDRERGTHCFLGNQLARISGDEADVETYVYRFDAAEAGVHRSPWHEHAERWEDRVVCDRGVWRVASHRACSNRVDA